MPIVRNSVLLLKSEKSEGGIDKYETLLTANNFEVIQIKTLTFIYKNLNLLKEELKKPQNYSGIIFSSPRCVSAVAQSLNQQEVKELWTCKSNFAVGETTHKEALNKLGLHCTGQESGNAQNLAKVIIQGKSQITKPFLFPHGNLKTDTLKLELGKEGLEIEGVLVYETLTNPSISEEFEKVTENFTKLPEFIVFFSPSGFRSSIDIIKSLISKSFKFIAIGPVTEQAIKDNNFTVHAVAKNPTAEDVLGAILSIKNL